MGWKINLWARALDGSRAHTVLHTALRHSTSYGTNQAAGGIYYNLYDSHAPFQIDGNFGACSGIMEMCLQSHTDTLCLLPALPTEWKSGQMNGLKAVGGYTVSQQWADGKLQTATITAAADGECHIRYAGLAGKSVSVNGTEVSYTFDDEANIAVLVKASDVISIDMTRESEVTPTTVAKPATAAPTVSVSSGKIIISGGTSPLTTTITDVAGRVLAVSAERSIAVPQGTTLVLVSLRDAAHASVCRTLALSE